MPNEIFISWDIDGTLILGNDATTYHLEAFHLACEELFGPCDTPEAFLGRTLDGWMDKRILAAMIEALGHEASEENISRAQQRMEDIFIETCTYVPDVCRGVVALLEDLSSRANVTMGLASGNFPRIAWRKLELCGLAKYFPQRIGGLGVVNDRADAVRMSRAMAERVTGKRFDVVMHIGDTPSDINAALQNNAIPFGVKTGRIHYPEYPTPSHIHEDLVEGRDELMRLLKL